MVRTAIQLYTLSKFDVTEPKKVRIAGETGVDGVEIVFDGPPSAETVEAVEATGLEVAGVTVGLADLRESMDAVVDACDTLDCDTVVLGHLDETFFESEAATRETADLLTTFAEPFRNRGLGFLYHTHRHEFDHIGDRTHFDVLVDETDDAVEFELDLGWIALTGIDPVDVIERAAQRTVSVHLKDMRFDDEEFVNLGHGDLDIESTAHAAIDSGVDWLVYEHEDPGDPVESVVTGASRLQKLEQMYPRAD